MSRQERKHQTKKSKWWLWLLLPIAIIAGYIVFTNLQGTGVDYTLYDYSDDAYKVENPKATVEEFSDFQCPFCQQLAPTMQALRETRTDVQFVFKQFPLTFVHPLAQKSAEASVCAEEQNRFWAYHDVLFDSKKLDSRSLKLHAKGLELDMSKWSECMSSGRAKAKISQDILEGRGRDVSGTPSVYIDGVKVDTQSIAASLPK